MAGAADILGYNDDLGGILAALNQLLTPTKQLPQQTQQKPSILAITQPQVSPYQAPQQQAMPAPRMPQLSQVPQGQQGSGGNLSQDASLAKNAYSAISSLFAPSLASYASSLLAPAAGEIGATVAPELASTAAGIQASNDAALASQIASEGESGAAAGSASGAAPSALSSAGYALAGPAAFAAMYGLGNELNAIMTGPNNNYSIGQINGMLDQAKQNENVLPPSMANGGAGSINAMNANGSVNQPLMSALTNLNQLQLGDFGQATPYVQQQLAGMGYSPVLAAIHGMHSSGSALGPGQAQLMKRF